MMKNPNNMKKNTILLLLAVLAFPACNDLLDLRSNGTITMDEVFTDRNRTRGYLDGCYSYRYDITVNAGSYTDDAQNSYDNTSGSYYDYWYNQGLTSSNFGAHNLDGNPWTRFFQGVRKCNVFLANIDGSTAKMSDSERAGWKAQALTLRAYYYLQLVKRYGRIPLILEDLGTTHDFSADTKATVGAVITRILADCDAALSVPDSDDYSYTVRDNQWGIMTKAVAQAVRSEAAVYAVSPLLDDDTFTKEQALGIAADALAQCLGHDYSLWTEASDGYSAYASYFLYNPNDLRAKDKETIYGGTRVAVWSGDGLPIVGGMSTAGSCPTQDLVDAYEMANGQVAITGYNDADHLQPKVNPASGYSESDPYKDRDPRFYATVFYNGSRRGADVVNTFVGGNCGLNATNIRYTHTGYYMRKYAHDKSNRNSNSDGYKRAIRLPELYFNFAELAYQVNGADAKVTASGLNLSAREAVNVVRARAGMPDLPAGLSASDFEARYRNERRIEFAMEADRYFCLRRWKILGEKTGFVTGMRITMEGGNPVYTRFRFEDRKSGADKYLLYPIDLSEERKTQTLTGTSWQNPGW